MLGISVMVEETGATVVDSVMAEATLGLAMAELVRSVIVAQDSVEELVEVDVGSEKAYDFVQ